MCGFKDKDEFKPKKGHIHTEWYDSYATQTLYWIKPIGLRYYSLYSTLYILFKKLYLFS